MFTYGPINYAKGTIMQRWFNMRDTCCNDSVSNTLQECYHAIHIFPFLLEAALLVTASKNITHCKNYNQ